MRRSIAACRSIQSSLQSSPEPSEPEIQLHHFPDRVFSFSWHNGTDTRYVLSVIAGAKATAALRSFRDVPSEARWGLGFYGATALFKA